MVASGSTRRRVVRTALAVVALVGACDDGGGSGPDTGAGTGASTTGAPTTTATVVAADRVYEVGQVAFTVVDEDRPTAAVAAAGLAGQPSRTIDVILLHPAGDGVPADGPFPLVVFAHGWNGRAETFVEAGRVWAAAGFVVALPTFPLSREGVAVSDDYVNQPGDISAVIDALVDGTDGAPSDLVDAERVAVGGHSLGSATVFRAAYNACCVDSRIDATIPVAGGPADIGQGGYESWPATPMLLVHGVLDPVVPIGVGDGVFELADVPIRYLRMNNADHNSVFVGENATLFADAVLTFLDLTLGNDEGAEQRLEDLVLASGIAELRTRLDG